MTLEIISPNEILFQGEAEMVNLPGEMGNFTVLRNHASLISVLKKGNVAYLEKDGKAVTLEIKGGIADVHDNVVSVCVY